MRLLSLAMSNNRILRRLILRRNRAHPTLSNKADNTLHPSMVHSRGLHTPNKGLLTPSRSTLLHNSRVFLTPKKSSSQIQTREVAAKLLRSTVRAPLPSSSQVPVPAALVTAGTSIMRCKWLAFSSLRLDRTVRRGVGSPRARTRSIHLQRCSDAPLLVITATSGSSP